MSINNIAESTKNDRKNGNTELYCPSELRSYIWNTDSQRIVLWAAPIKVAVARKLRELGILDPNHDSRSLFYDKPL
jgi:hypothetical protein